MRLPETPWDDAPEKECLECEELRHKLENITDFMDTVIWQLWGRETYDKVKLENAIDEICFSLGKKIPDGQIVLEASHNERLRKWHLAIAEFTGAKV